MSNVARRALARVATALSLALVAGAAFAARPAQTLVDDHKMQGEAFERVAPFASRFDVATGESRVAGTIREAVRQGRVLSVDKTAIKDILRDRPQTMALDLPTSTGNLVLELVRVNPFAAGFKVTFSDGSSLPKNALGVHYRGAVRGDENSLAAISVFEHEIMGFAQTQGEHLVIGRLDGENRGNQHIVYPESAMTQEKPWKCDMETASDFSAMTGEEMLNYYDASHASGLRSLYDAVQRPVGIWVEADYDVYQNKGSGTASYLTGLFNQSATLYSNESIPIVISQMYIWTRRSPYKGQSSSQLLSQFQAKRNDWVGDLGHLVALRGGGGIAAGFSGFCAVNRDNSQCFSAINTSYSNVPTYSWSVMVFTHEMGHLMGSRHTHACVWNGDNTQIDGCYNPEGTCSLAPYPSGGGTIMSYCHLSGRPGINFNNGFGPQPGAVIRNNYNGAGCLNQ